MKCNTCSLEQRGKHAELTTLVEKRIAAGSSWHFASRMERYLVEKQILSFRLSSAPIKAVALLWWSQSKAQASLEWALNVSLCIHADARIRKDRIRKTFLNFLSSYLQLPIDLFIECSL